MSSESTQSVVVVSDEQRARAKELMAAGFVHVTGLPACNYWEDAGRAAAVAVAKALDRYKIVEAGGADPNAFVTIGETKYVIQAERRWLGHSDYNNGVGVIVTHDGEVWIGTSMMACGGVRCKYGPRQGAFVPCSNGESIPMHLLMERVANPYSDCDGKHSPAPAIKEPETHEPPTESGE